MFELVVNGAFEAAHRLYGYNGKCRNLHGHSWIVELSVSGTNQDDVGIVVDFKVLKGMLNDLLDRLDHQFLNDIPYFKDNNLNPTAENLSKFIFDTLKENEIFKNDSGNTLNYIKVWESPKACVIYRGDNK